MTAMSGEPVRYYEFGAFRLDATERLLFREQEVVPLTPKVFDLLLVLVQADGSVVPKDDIMTKVWRDTFVEEGNLTQNVSILRKALGDGQDGFTYVETIPRRGYRFAADVRCTGERRATPLVREATTTPLAQQESSPAYTEAAPNSRGRQRVIALGLVIIAAVITVAGTLYFTRRPVAGDIPKAIDSIAVLPFVNDTSEYETQHIEDEITEGLINSLSQLPKLRVAPRTMVLRYKENQTSLRDIGRALGVRALLTGRVHKSGNSLSIQVDLINVSTLSQIWGEHYDIKLSDVLLAHESISHEIVENLRLKLSQEEEKQIEAYRLYLRGRNYWNKRTVEGLKEGIENFNSAIEVDPEYAPAYAGLADCYNMLVVYGVRTPKDAFPMAKEAALKALQFDQTLAEAHTSLAFVLFRFDRDRLGAEREFQLAIKHKPSYAPAHQWYSSYLAAVERFDEAIAEARRTQELEPLSLITDSHLAWILYLAGRNDEAIAECNKLLEVDPAFFPAHRYLGLAYESKHLYPEAIAEFEQGVKLSGSPLMLALLGHSYAMAGNTTAARKVLADLKGMSARKYVSPYTIAAIYAGLGENDEALRWLETAHDERDIWLMNLRVDPVFVSLRSEPRFKEIVIKAGLNP
ncbi:MAG TPA: winged helix-turn-helix domain-containing protein [Blastocatellia bacterium]|nr:winged helix-turn-helix domain-containing protein [Blastocatellia bacterium]